MTKKTTVITLIICIILAGGYASQVYAMDTKIGTPITMPQFPVLTERYAGTGLPNLQVFFPALFNLETPVFLPWVDTDSKSAVRNYYLNNYLASNGVDPGWTGNHKACNPGTTSVAFREAILHRINYFRAMSGVPEIVGFRSDFNQKAQSAALMMSVNENLSHDPPASWTCYSNDGNEAAGKSNLYLGRYGPEAISGYIDDPGSNNYPVGHRRWILYPQTEYMGTGDIPPVSGERSANSLWVIELDTIWGQRPETRDAFVAWPPKGYVPRQLIFPRWSFSYAKADFSSTTVELIRDKKNINISVSPVVDGYGENTIVWQIDENLPVGDVIYNVTLTDVKINGSSHNFSYEVKIFDPTE